jgi:hypothetical protein
MVTLSNIMKNVESKNNLAKHIHLSKMGSLKGKPIP